MRHSSTQPNASTNRTASKACHSVRSQRNTAADSGSVELTTDPDTAAHLFWVAAHGLVSLELGGFLVVGRTMDELLPALFSTMTTGMTTDAATQREVD